MALESNLTCISAEAGSDLSAAQYTFVAMASDGAVDQTSSATAAIVGVLQNDPAAGKAATVAVAGVTKLVASAAIASGAEVGVQTGGKCRTASTGVRRHGVALTAAATDGDIIEVLLLPNGDVA